MTRKDNLRRVLLLCALAVPVTAGAATVVVTESEQRPVMQIVNLSGSVTSPKTALLSTSVGGLIQTMHVDAGDRVEKGNVLVTLDRELADLELERTIAQEAQASTLLDDARRRLREAEELRENRVIAETQIKSLEAEVTRTEAELRAASAALRQQEAIVRRHEIRAPFAGVVSERVAEVGEWVNPGTGLVSLVATDELRFDFRVSQAHYASITDDTIIALTLDALPGQTIQGRIQAVVPVKDPGARTFLLRAVADPDHTQGITPGMSARAELRLDAGRQAVVVPRDALLRHPDGRRTVWVAETDGEQATVSERRVDTGLEFDGVIEIRNGLEAGVPVVVRGNEALQDGQAVTVQ